MTASYFIGVTENGASAIGGGGGGVSCRSFATWTIKRYRGTTGRRASTVYSIMYVYVPGSKLPVSGMVIPPLIRNPYNTDTNPYYWVDDHPLP